jgi:hypothetical protein
MDNKDIDKLKIDIQLLKIEIKGLKTSKDEDIILFLREKIRAEHKYSRTIKNELTFPNYSVVQEQLKTEKMYQEKRLIEAKRELKLLKRKKIELENTTPDETKIISINKRNFENNFDNVEQNKVYDYFRTELFDKNYLKEETLNEYLQLAFQDNCIPKEKFNFLKINTKQTLTRIFYKYYKDIASKPYGKQPKYIKLLTDYFNGYDYDTVKTNFNK